jgi:hypothetical protein
MNNPTNWAGSIIAIAVGRSPGLAVLSARSVARLIHYTLGPRREVMREPKGQLTRDEPTSAITSRCDRVRRTAHAEPHPSQCWPAMIAVRDGALTVI